MSACQMLLGLQRIILRMSAPGETRAVHYIGEGKKCVSFQVLICFCGLPGDEFQCMSFAFWVCSHNDNWQIISVNLLINR